MNRHGMIAAVLVGIALTANLGAQETAFDAGVRMIREGRFDEALVKLEEAHHIEPHNAIIENLLGITETKLGHIGEADDHYRHAIALDPAQAAPHRNLGVNYLSAKDYVHAAPELREAARLSSGDPFAHYYLLQLALATGHDSEAVEEASRAGKLVENDPETNASVAEAEIRTGHADAAGERIEQLEQAGQLPPAREYQIAVLLSGHALYGEAVHCFRRIATLDPTWDSRYNLALALLYDGQPAEASALLSALHKERPAHADTLMFLGSALETQQKMPEALEAYRAALVADPSNPDRTLDYTRLLMDMDRYDEAIQVVQTGLGETSSTAPLQLRLGAVEMVKGNYTAARDAFKSALDIDPQLDTAYVGLAQTYARQANDPEAIHVLETAREKLPGHYLLEYYFGLLASRLGRVQEAILALEKAAQLQPKSPDPFFELGKIYSSQRDWPKARDAFVHAVELNPEFAPAHYQLSQVYARLGLRSKAEDEAHLTHTLVEAQRDRALKEQLERGANFQPHSLAAPAP